MSQTETTRNETYKNRLALLLSMLEAGNPDEVVKVDHLSSQELAGSEDTDLTELCGGSGWYYRPTKAVGPYLKLRMKR